MTLSLLVGLAAYAPTAPLSCAAARSRAPRMAADPLRTFLQNEAGVAPKFLDRVINICDKEMIGNPEQLQIALDAGLLPQARAIPPFPP